MGLKKLYHILKRAGRFYIAAIKKRGSEKEDYEMQQW